MKRSRARCNGVALIEFWTLITGRRASESVRSTSCERGIRFAGTNPVSGCLDRELLELHVRRGESLTTMAIEIV